MKKSDFVFFTLILILLGVVFYGISLIKQETAQCLKNPFVYGASHMKDVSCSCQQGSTLCPAQFSFNDSSFRAINTKCGVFGSGKSAIIDFGDLNITIT